MKGKQKYCASCRDSENNEPAIGLFSIIDPDGNDMPRRMYLCADHDEMFSSDGYEVTLIHN